MNISKKVIAVLLALMMMLSCVGAVAFAEDDGQTTSTSAEDETSTEFTILTDDEKEQLSEVGDDIRDVVDNGVNLLSWTDRFMEMFRKFVDAIAEIFEKLGNGSNLFNDLINRVLGGISNKIENTTSANG